MLGMSSTMERSGTCVYSFEGGLLVYTWHQKSRFPQRLGIRKLGNRVALPSTIRLFLVLEFHGLMNLEHVLPEADRVK